MNSPVIDYAIRVLNPQAHSFEVRCTVPHPDPV